MTVGLLICDLPAQPVLIQDGDYYKIFTQTFNIPLVPFQVFKGELPLQEELKDFNAFIITGSSASAYDDVDWIIKFIQFLRKVDQETSIKIVGICFGFQILALALGGTVVKNEQGWEVGPTLLNSKSFIQSMHQDIVLEVPKGWVNLASSDKCLHQFSVFKDRYFCLQGHPEYTRDMVAKIVDFRKNRWTVEFYNQVRVNLDTLQVDSSVWIKMILDFLNQQSNREDLRVIRNMKLYDLPQESIVLCTTIGKKSGQVLVTGGDDRKVNVWALGNKSPLLSLAGHSSPVSAIALDWQEELVVAGSTAGALKLWDLDSAKVVRTLIGHKSTATALEFHPFGDFFASGSKDLSIKIWDIRRKGCIQTYQGHSEQIDTLKITPDGRWIATGSIDKTVKIWDMTAGKLIHSIENISGAITSLSFHPTEFLMAVSSTDGLIKVFDLQSFECISTSQKINNAKLVNFSQDGTLAYTATSDSFKTFSWEPWSAVHSVDVSWPNVDDFYVFEKEKRVVGISKESNLVGVWMIDLAEPASSASTHSPVTPSFSVNFNQISLEDPNVMGNIQVQPQNPTAASSHSRSQSSNPPAKPVCKSTAYKFVPISDGNKALNLDISNFISAGGSRGNSNPLPLSPGDISSHQSEKELQESLLSRHTSLCNIFQSRLSSIRCVRDVWDENNIKSAVEVLTRTRDPALWIDILRILNLRPRLLTLDVAILLLPILRDLLHEVFEDYILTCCDTIKLLIKCFSGVISSTLTNVDFSGIDISREERIEKCRTCKGRFLELEPRLIEISNSSSKVKDMAQDTLNELNIFNF